MLLAEILFLQFAHKPNTKHDFGKPLDWIVMLLYMMFGKLSTYMLLMNKLSCMHCIHIMFGQFARKPNTKYDFSKPLDWMLLLLSTMFGKMATYIHS
jgi:hypothetical protein